MVCIVRGLYVVTLLHVLEFCMFLSSAFHFQYLLFIAVYWKLAGIGLAAT